MILTSLFLHFIYIHLQSCCHSTTPITLYILIIINVTRGNLSVRYRSVFRNTWILKKQMCSYPTCYVYSVALPVVNNIVLQFDKIFVFYSAIKLQMNFLLRCYQALRHILHWTRFKDTSSFTFGIYIHVRTLLALTKSISSVELLPSSGLARPPPAAIKKGKCDSSSPNLLKRMNIVRP